MVVGEDQDTCDAEHDGNGNCNCVGSSSTLSLYWILRELNCATSKENNLLKNSYDAKNNAPCDTYITDLGINPLIM